MNCEAYIAFYRNGELTLHPNNIDPDIVKELCDATLYNPYDGRRIGGSKYLVIKRKGDILYYAYIAELDDNPDNRIIIMTSLNNVVIDEVFALEAFMRYELIDIGHTSRSLRYDDVMGQFKTDKWDEYELLKYQSSLRKDFNNIFFDKTAHPGSVDYSMVPGVDIFYLHDNSERRRAYGGERYSGLSIRRSIEVGNTVVIVRIESHWKSVDLAKKVKKQQTEIDSLGKSMDAKAREIINRDQQITDLENQLRILKSNKRPKPTPDTKREIQEETKKKHTVIGAILGVISLIIANGWLNHISIGFIPVDLEIWHICPDYLITYSPVYFSLALGGVFQLTCRRFQSFYRSVLITFALIFTFGTVNLIIDPFIDAKPLIAYYNLTFMCIGISLMSLITSRKEDRLSMRHDSQTKRNGGYLSGLILAAIWAGPSYLAVYDDSIYYSLASVLAIAIPALTGTAAGILRYRNIWTYRSALCFSLVAEGLIMPDFMNYLFLISFSTFITYALTANIITGFFNKERLSA